MTLAPDTTGPDSPANPDVDPASRYRRALEGVIGVPATEGNRVDVLRNGDEIFPAMLEAIGGAEHTVDLLTFVYWKGEVGRAFADALAERARVGVRVRVLLDGWGARTIERSLVALLEESGVAVRWFRPLGRLHLGQFNHRTHRKVMIVDERVGFTGGVGIADEWQGDARNADEWRDTHFRVRGPAVDGLRSAFLDNWLETDPTLFDESVDRFPFTARFASGLVPWPLSFGLMSRPSSWHDHDAPCPPQWRWRARAPWRVCRDEGGPRRAPERRGLPGA